MRCKFLTSIAIAILLWGCNNRRTSSNETHLADTVDTIEEYIPINATGDTLDMHNAQNSLDVVGTYKGILPCADCEGIETVITLNEDDTFSKKIKYLGKADEEVSEETGNYTWVSGSTISLSGEDLPNQYFVGENTLTALDTDGLKVTGALATDYVLKKQ